MARTVVLIRDSDTVIVVDRGMVRSRADILGPLKRLGLTAEAVTDVVFSHHHPDVTQKATPGHTAEDITTLVATANGLVACTHLVVGRRPAVDPLAVDQVRLERSRAEVLALGPRLIVPGHGAPFTP